MDGFKRWLIFHRRAAKDAEVNSLLLSIDPRGIGFASHRAGTPESKKMHLCVIKK